MAKASRSTRVLRILEVIAAAERPLRVTDVVNRSGLPKAAVHRIAALLRDERFLREEVGQRGLVAGPRLRQFAKLALTGRGENAIRHAILESIARRIDESCNFAVPDDKGMVHLDRAHSPWPMQLHLPIGDRLPFHATASGKLYLSSLSPGCRKRLLRHLPLERYTATTITEPVALEAALKAIAKTGVGVGHGEFVEGMLSVAVPVLTGARGEVLATLSFYASQSRMNLKQALAHVETLRAGADALAGDIMAVAEVSDGAPAEALKTE